MRQYRWNRLLQCALLSVLPVTTDASVSTKVAWNPSPDSSVTGYNVYYGTSSHSYMNMVSVGNVTSATINNLTPGVTYYFAATAHDAAGNQSPYSNEACFADYFVTAGARTVLLNTMPPALQGDQLNFSLAAGAPAGISIDPSSGLLSWNMTLTNASSVNHINISVSDVTNPGANTKIAIVLAVSDYLNMALASMPVQAGKNASLPLTAVSSDAITNLTFNLAWPGTRLLNPSLALVSPVSGGTLQNQGTNLVIRLRTGKAGVAPGTHKIATINFRTALSQATAFFPIPATRIAASKTNGSAFVNIIPGNGEVVLVGTTPLLRPVFSGGQGRRLTLYANTGKTYLLQYRTSLSSPAGWQTLLTYSQTNLQQTFQLDSTNPVVFYRLKQK